MGITQDKRRRELELEMRRLFYVYRHVPTALFASRLLLHPLSVVKTHLQVFFSFSFLVCEISLISNEKF